MGKYNSSKYRVRPLMEVIENDFSTLTRILKLVDIDGLSLPQSYWYDGIDRQEMQLKPSKMHLIKLIHYISQKDFEETVITNKKRKTLCIPDKNNPNSRMEARDEAIAELDRTYEHMTASCRAWYVFEGFTCPDIYIEGDDYVILCEGKWTEPHITVQTTNLTSKNGEYRNQMTRHIQGTLNATTKKVYAFYIVDKDCGYLEDVTKEAFCNQLSLETIPLDPVEKASIMDSFKGYITWQDIEDIIPSIHFQKKEDI